MPSDFVETFQAGERTPVDLVLAADETWLATVNELSGSLSLVDVAAGTVIDEQPCGIRPTAIASCLDGNHLVVSGDYSGEVHLFEVRNGALLPKTRIPVGSEPIGIAVSPDGQRAYVGLMATGEVAELDLTNSRVLRKIVVGLWPRHLAVSPDGTRLAVGCSGESKIVVVNIQRGAVEYEVSLSGGINIGHLQCSSDGRYAYFPWMIYRSNPISKRNIRRGWVLASRIGRVRLDGPAYREAISLDVAGQAVADPHGLALSPNQHRLVVSASGTHELLVYRQADLPFIGIGGPGDLIDQRLLADDDLFARIEVGGRPMGVAIAADNQTAYVANYTLNIIQEVDLELHQVIREIPLGPQPPASLVRQGMSIFYDARYSLDQWYSCHSCHYNGGVNSKPMDTLNDGSQLTMKTVLPLQNVQHTHPWTWHGWQSDLIDSIHQSFTTTMQGEPVSDEDARAVLAFLSTLPTPPSSYRGSDGSLSDAALRGKRVFEGSRAGCANCHHGPFFTDGQVHDIGLGSEEDRFEGFNTPSLLGVHRKVRFLHDGRAKSLEAVLTDAHAPENVSGTDALSEKELADLIEYLKSL